MYRILLPSSLRIEPRELARTLVMLPVCIPIEPLKSWEVGTLPDSYGHLAAAHAEVHLLSPDEVSRAPSEAYFYTPRGVHCWVEVRAMGTVTDRALRLKARLVALRLSQALNLPVLETRNGVMCTTPDAFVAWCARQPHSKIQKLGGWEHVTVVPARRKTRTPAEAAKPRGWVARTWRRMRGPLRYTFALPNAPLSVAQALRDELARTFPQHTVRYQAKRHEIVIAAKTGPPTTRTVVPRDTTAESPGAPAHSTHAESSTTTQ